MLFDMSGVEEADLPYVGILQGVLGVIDTENYKYGELFNEINVHTGGIGTSLELYTDISKVHRKKNSKQHLKSKERHYIRSCQSYSG